ncbi:MAG: zinc ribbon domain-containing protein [Candidatus Korarchaeota archaeon NZ13-K]|nr:MAG: zinc ribbon domain-containing protein [Candidatus Korarchaeota archaeon NZ13-K]
MPTRLSLRCRSCGFEVDASSSDDPLPGSCPSCGSSDLEFSVSLIPLCEGEMEERPEEVSAPMIDGALVRQVSPGEYLIDPSAMSGEVIIAELEPGVYEIVIRAYHMRFSK